MKYLPHVFLCATIALLQLTMYVALWADPDGNDILEISAIVLEPLFIITILGAVVYGLVSMIKTLARMDPLGPCVMWLFVGIISLVIGGWGRSARQVFNHDRVRVAARPMIEDLVAHKDARGCFPKELPSDIMVPKICELAPEYHANGDDFTIRWVACPAPTMGVFTTLDATYDHASQTWSFAYSNLDGPANTVRVTARR